MIVEYDKQKWLEEILHKPSLQWYRLGKEKIGYDQCYRNSKQSAYLAKTRKNSLQLEDQLGRGIENYNKTCKLCKLEDENLEYFLIKCPVLQRKRDPIIISTNTNLTPEQQTAHILFKEKQYEKTAKMIKNMWDYRKDVLRPP